MKAKHLLVALSAVALFAAAPVPAPVILDVPATVNELRVHEGIPGNLVGVCLGFEEIRVEFPGNALLRVEPVLTFVLGTFDEQGKFVLPLSWTGDPVEPATMFLQALSVDENGFFSMSELCRVRFDGEALFHIEPV